MIPPLDPADVAALPDVQLLLRLRTLREMTERLASEISGAEAGIYSRKPDWLVGAKQQ